MTIKIPIQLKEQFFCRIKHKKKKPFEYGWQNKLYTYEQIQAFLPSENYGVLTGINQLGILDDDTEDKTLMKTFEEHFGKTFRVRDHYYIRLNGWDCQKIIFWKNGDSSKKENHMGELQGKGQQAVCVGSTHPTGVIYELVEDLPIKEIEYNDFIAPFKEFLAKPKKPKPLIKPAYIHEDDFLEKIKAAVSMPDVLSSFNVNTSRNPTACPLHSSRGGKCLSFNYEFAHCFHCQEDLHEGWNIFSFVKEVKNCDFKEALEYLADLAGLSDELKQNKKNYAFLHDTIHEPRGWALSVSIVKLAQEHELINCPKCNHAFIFNDNLGWFRCKRCGLKGGLKDFAKIILWKQKEQLT